MYPRCRARGEIELCLTTDSRFGTRPHWQCLYRSSLWSRVPFEKSSRGYYFVLAILTGGIVSTMEGERYRACGGFAFLDFGAAIASRSATFWRTRGINSRP